MRILFELIDHKDDFNRILMNPIVLCLLYRVG